MPSYWNSDWGQWQVREIVLWSLQKLCRHMISEIVPLKIKRSSNFPRSSPNEDLEQSGQLLWAVKRPRDDSVVYKKPAAESGSASAMLLASISAVLHVSISAVVWLPVVVIAGPAAVYLRTTPIDLSSANYVTVRPEIPPRSASVGGEGAPQSQSHPRAHPPPNCAPANHTPLKFTTKTVSHSERALRSSSGMCVREYFIFWGEVQKSRNMPVIDRDKEIKRGYKIQNRKGIGWEEESNWSEDRKNMHMKQFLV